MMSQSNVFQLGLLSPIIAAKAVINVPDDTALRIEIDEIKKCIIEMLKTSKPQFVSDIAEKLNVQPNKVVIAIKQLREEGFIRDAE